MSERTHRSVWFGRIVLAAASFLLIRIGIGYVTDPAGAVAPYHIALGSAAALTNTRVSGGVFLGIALALVACLASTRRHLAGLGFLVAVAAAILAVRVVGLVVDGPAAWTLFVLKPEVALVVLSAAAFYVERRRRARAAHG